MMVTLGPYAKERSLMEFDSGGVIDDRPSLKRDWDTVALLDGRGRVCVTYNAPKRNPAYSPSRSQQGWPVSERTLQWVEADHEVGLSFPYTGYVETGTSRAPAKVRRPSAPARACRAAAAGCVAVWALLVALAVGARDRYRAWRDEPLRLSKERAEALAELVRTAPEEAAFADANGMPQSAEVWRQIAAQARPEHEDPPVEDAA